MLLGDGHPWSQTEGPEALNLTELKLCGTDLGNFWNIYFNEVSLAGHVVSHGSRGSWGSAHSQSHHELVCRNVLSGKHKTGSTTTSHRERPVLQQQGSWNASPGLLVLYFSHSAIIFSVGSQLQNFFFFSDWLINTLKVYVCFLRSLLRTRNAVLSVVTVAN